MRNLFLNSILYFEFHGDDKFQCARKIRTNNRMPRPLNQIIRLVMFLNLGYFVFEFTVALSIGSVSLFADSIDFLEDGLVNLLILIALNWSMKHRSRVGMALAGILMIPGLATLWTAWSKFHIHVPPQPIPLTLTGLGAFAVNFSCSLMLARYRKHAGSLTHAAFLSARNDVLANIAIIVAGLATVIFPSVWPDLIVGLGIAVMNADAAREVWKAAREEHQLAKDI
jgi:Co/Zn/Cd efflux system component